MEPISTPSGDRDAASCPSPQQGIVESIVDWYTDNARDLPWRSADCSAWGVFVSEFMLQQTPVARVLQPWQQWLQRWPVPAALAAEPAGEAIRAWGRLGYPRRALRLHAAATAMVERHDGQVPEAVSDLIALPGVGSYTAAAVASFAFGQREVVLDTNVRRLLGRLLDAEAMPRAHQTKAEREQAAGLLPADDREAARWASASMELGALVCTARAPDCANCPVRDRCAWCAAGRPASALPRSRQGYAGTDRQCRGALLAILRDTAEPVPEQRIDLAWSDQPQRERAVAGLLADGLMVKDHEGFRLP